MSALSMPHECLRKGKGPKNGEECHPNKSMDHAQRPALSRCQVNAGRRRSAGAVVHGGLGVDVDRLPGIADDLLVDDDLFDAMQTR